MRQALLLPTDLSKSSKAGLRFAVQLASQQHSKLIFYHVLHVPMPTRWNQETYMNYVDDQINETKARLMQFVGQVFRQTGFSAKNAEYVVEFKPFVDSSIIDYAILRKVNFICMSTRGAGFVKRILGTNTSAVLSKSPIPVFAVPYNYRRSRVSHVLYASDLTALVSELKQVRKVATAWKSKLTVIHYGHLFEPDEMRRKFEAIKGRYGASGVRFVERRYNIERSMPQSLKEAVRKHKPSVLAVFTNQDKNLIQRIFPRSNSERLSFDSPKPLLVFPK